MSETSARARRRAFWFGSFARNGLIGFLWTGVAGAGVDGVENAADTLPLAPNATGGVAGLDGVGDCGIAALGGGVSGAPNEAFNSDAGLEPCGAGSFGIAGACRGENGGVRRRAGDSGSALRAPTGAEGGAAVVLRGGSVAPERGSGGGHAAAAVDAAGVLALDGAVLGPEGVAPSGAPAGVALGED